MINIGDTIDNRYNVLEHLGTGGMADVFEAFVAERWIVI